MTEKIKIIDAHCHIASEENIPQSFIDGAIKNMLAVLEAQGIGMTREKLSGIYKQKIKDPLCDDLIAEMDQAGISKSFLLAADFTYTLDDCEITIEETYKKHSEILARHPGRFEVFGGMDPRWGKDGLELFERSITQMGFCGFKVYPPCGFSPSDPTLFPFYEICSSYQVPVVVHIGPTSPALSFTNTYPFLIDDAAHNFPNVNFILAHGSVSFTEECTMMCAFRPNLFLDISAFQKGLGHSETYNAVKMIFSKGINHKILFGTDWPVFRLQGDQKTFVDELIKDDGLLSDLSETDRRMILGGNAERLLANVKTKNK